MSGATEKQGQDLGVN